ncbi:MAG: PilN domain-containing protein [Holophaga sp.]|nr:PilN domain-containing protein [Holophaga sp.]
MIKINLLGDTLAQVAGKRSEKADATQVYAQGDSPARASLPIAGIVVGLLIASCGVVYYLILDRDLRQAQDKVVKLEQEKQSLAKYTALEKTFREQKESIQKKKEIMMGLKNTQELPVHLLEELANALPDDVWFKEISQKGLAITVKAESTSFEAINLFRNRLIEQSKWFGNVNSPAGNKKGGVVEFSISFDLKKPA